MIRPRLTMGIVALAMLAVEFFDAAIGIRTGEPVSKEPDVASQGASPPVAAGGWEILLRAPHH